MFSNNDSYDHVNHDRRSGFRAQVALPVKIEAHENPSLIYNGIIHDISISGVSLSIIHGVPSRNGSVNVKKNFDIDDIITLHFPLQQADSRMCTCNCSIVRFIGSVNYLTRKYGCKFISLSENDRIHINNLITHLRTEEMKKSFDRFSL